MSKNFRIILGSLAGIFIVSIGYMGFQARWILWYVLMEPPVCMTDAHCWEWKCRQYPQARGCVTTSPEQ